MMTALFNFQSLLLVILLLICTSTYAHGVFPSILDNRKDGETPNTTGANGGFGMDRILGIFWKFARIGERLSPYVSICCVLMAASVFVGS
ncbi:DUF1242-domain-containing protein [Saccharata proteae CBS 121410]|uniref:Protein kish n=1 Tax=Saccharata proteae CBS 121410 TaxID=1314787 RepID=A0A9P4LVL0_9PEZI|nr:DUF1242-domain-containing protein [Saccharata proteae CBS 121410]